MFSYQPPLPELPAGWTCSQMDVQTYTTKFDLSVELDERAEGLIGRFVYNTDLFEDATMLRMIGHLETLLEGIVADPGEHIAQLPLLREDERRTLLVDWNATQVSYSQDGCLHQCIEAQVERFAPGFRDRILACSVRGPADLERDNPNYIGGDINAGIEDFRQLFTRPVARLDPYSTPARGIYLCSSSTPPGGGVHGMCGVWAARSALRREFGGRV